MRNWILACLIGLQLFGCSSNDIVEGEGAITNQTHEIAAFDKLIIRGQFDVEIQNGAVNELAVTTHENLHPYVSINESNKRLFIELTSNVSINSQTPIKIVLTTPKFKELHTFGSNRTHVSNLNSEDFLLKSSGANKTNISGHTKHFHTRSQGALKLNAKALESDDVDITSHGTCVVSVHAKHKLSIKSHGSSNIVYKGQPEHLEKEIHGSGVVRAG